MGELYESVDDAHLCLPLLSSARSLGDSVYNAAIGCAHRPVVTVQLFSSPSRCFFFFNLHQPTTRSCISTRRHIPRAASHPPTQTSRGIRDPFLRHHAWFSSSVVRGDSACFSRVSPRAIEVVHLNLKTQKHRSRRQQLHATCTGEIRKHAAKRPKHNLSRWRKPPPHPRRLCFRRIDIRHHKNLLVVGDRPRLPRPRFAPPPLPQLCQTPNPRRRRNTPSPFRRDAARTASSAAR